MLPKPEKKSKKDAFASSGVEQLDIVNTLSDHDKVQKKRRTITIILIITAGLSLFFWAYRSLQSIVKHPPSFDISFSIPKPFGSQEKNTTQNHLDLYQPVRSVLKNDSNPWSVYVQTLGVDQRYWSLDGNVAPGLVSSTIQTLQVLPPAPSAVISILPQGTNVKEQFSESANSLSYKVIILVPDNPIFIDINASGSDLSATKKLLNPLIETIYWQTAPIIN